MLVYEAKLEGKQDQYRRLDEAIRTGQFIRNSCLRYWLDGHGKSRHDLNRYCKVLADNPEFPWAKKLNSMARQAMAERAWVAIYRFYENCAQGLPGKKGFPKFKRLQTRSSVEYKTSGWKLSEDRRFVTFTDGFEAGTFKLWGTRDLHFYQLNQIKRVRVVRRSDGYYAQFCIDHDRVEKHEFKNRMVGLDMGLIHFLTDSDGNQIENPRYLRKNEKALKRIQRRVSKREKGSKNRAKAINRLGRKHLKVQRQRKDFAVKTARCVIQSSDLVAIEDLKVRNMVKNRHLAKSISDAAWSLFREWLAYFGRISGVSVIAVAPHYTSQNCSSCGQEVKKALSIRTHVCPHCGYIADRDLNAALNILMKALSTVGHTGINAWGENDLCAQLATVERKPTRRAKKPKQ
jgi:putative transposase